MEWQIILIAVLTLPIVIIPVAFVWYLNVGGVFTTIKEARKRRATRDEDAGAVVETEQ